MKNHPPDWVVLCGVWIVALLIVALDYAGVDGLRVSTSGKVLILILAMSWSAGVMGVNRFKNACPDQYIILGSAQLFGSPYAKGTWRLLFFLFTLKYLRITDGLAKIYLSFFIVGSLSFLIAILFWNE
jgi:hypothetical protein